MPALDEHRAGFGAAVLRAVGVVDDVHADFVHGEFHLRPQLAGFRPGRCQHPAEPRAQPPQGQRIGVHGQPPGRVTAHGGGVASRSTTSVRSSEAGVPAAWWFTSANR
ncbi:MAG TPA: hypothetical protein VIJ00_07715 [Nakamurella sp.]